MSNGSQSQSFLVEVNGRFITTPSPASELDDHDKKLAVTLGGQNDAAAIYILGGFLCTGSKPNVLFLGRLIDEPRNSEPPAMYWTIRSDMLKPYQSGEIPSSLAMGSDDSRLRANSGYDGIKLVPSLSDVGSAPTLACPPGFRMEGDQAVRIEDA